MNRNNSNENAFSLLKSGSDSKVNTDINTKSQITAEERLNNCLESVFNFSLKPTNEIHQTYFLKHLSQSHDGQLLKWQDLDNALLERLGVYDPEIESSSSSAPASTFNRLNYLLKCFFNARTDLISKYSDDAIFIEEVVKESRKWIIKYTITYLLEPSIFHSTKYDFETYALILSSLRDDAVSKFLVELRSKIKAEELNLLLSPALLVVVAKLKLYDLCVTDQEYIDAVDILNYFTSDEDMAKILVNSPAFLPSSDIIKATAREFSTETIFGLLFGAVCTDSNRETPIYFNFPYQTQSDYLAITHSIRTSLTAIYDRLIQSWKRLLAHSKLKDQLYIWLHFCLLSHAYRCKLGTSLQLTFGYETLDGFFVNLAYVALKICSPIASDWSKMIPRVDYSYYQYAHQWKDMSNQAYLIEYDDVPMIFNKEREKLPKAEKIFNFATHWYFATHEIIRIGLVPAMDKYTKYMENLQRMNDQMQSLEMEEQVQLKSQMHKLMGEQCCLMAHLLDPLLLDFLVEFLSATSVHLLNAIGCNLSVSLQWSCTELPEGCPLFQYVPEHILDQLATCTIFLMNFSSESLTKFNDRLYSIILCCSLFMGSNEYVTNPHLRAKLAQVLCILIIHDKNMHNSAMLPVKTLLETNRVLSTILPRQLFRLFVDIEFTGHAHEFQQKFSYRYHMYKILFYIWDIPEYLETIHLLSKEAETTNIEIVPLFLKFINLLINDSTYLLDEALSLIIKIHDIECEISTPQWFSLPKETQLEKYQLLQTSRKTVESYNILSLDTVKTLLLLTKDMPKPFFSLTMVDRIAAMLNYFLHHLVGEKKRELKVKEMDKLHFDPKELVSMICEAFANLSIDDRFLTALVEDERSFSINLMTQALDVLHYIIVDSQLIDRFTNLKERLSSMYKIKSERAVEFDEIPDEFTDPISCCLMQDPVLLPESKQIVDRTTITKHLLSDETDPFNRAHLTVSMLIPQPELKSKIKEWLSNRKK